MTVSDCSPSRAAHPGFVPVGDCRHVIASIRPQQRMPWINFHRTC